MTRTADPLTEPTPEQHAVHHRTREQLDAVLEHVRAAPLDDGSVELLLRRPAAGEREVRDELLLTVEGGVEGDRWRDGAARVDSQVNVMGARAVAAVAGDPDRRRWAGDQLFLDLHLGVDQLPAGTRLRVGEAVLEVTEKPHRGCLKFERRFGAQARAWASSEEGEALRLRGLNARVVEPGVVRVGDRVTRV